jgi:hypothetical protein
VDRRFHERYPAGLQVRVTSVDDPSLSASGDVCDVSGSGISAYLPLQLTVGSAVKLTVHDSVLFGFVAHSEPDRSYFRTGISVLQVLIGGSNLSQLLKATIEEAMPEVRLQEAPTL